MGLKTTLSHEKPMQTSKTYSISKIKTLVDLNKDILNFRLNFSVTSKNKQPFLMTIMDETTINTPDTPVPYQDIKSGHISGELVWNRNVKQTYYMVLESATPMEVVVDLIITELDPEKTPDKTLAKPQDKTQAQTQAQTSTQDDSTRYYIYIAIAVILGGILWMVLSGKGSGGGGGLKPSSILARLKKMQLKQL